MGSPPIERQDDQDLEEMASATSQEQNSSSQDFFAPTQFSRSSPVTYVNDKGVDAAPHQPSPTAPSSALQPLFFCDDDDDEMVDVKPSLRELSSTAGAGLKRTRSPSNDHQQSAAAKHARTESSAQPQPTTTEPDGELDEWERRYLGSFVIRALTTSDNVREGTRVRLWHTAAKEQAAPKKATSAFFRSKQQKSNEDYVVYMDDVRNGKHVARTSAEEGKWIVKLLDQKLASFEGVVVVGPQSTSRLADIYVQVKAYILRSAFSRQDHTATMKSKSLADTESTMEERKIRARKKSLAQLFKKCALKPSSRADVSEQNSPEPRGSNSPSNSEVIDLDAIDDDLTGSQVEDLYSRATKAARLPQVEPADTFAMELRPYQKQALGWMKKMEQPIGAAVTDLNGQQLLDPLWREYEFPFNDDLDEQSSRDNKELLEAHARSFYFSPSTGEISVRFVETKHTARGGILADEMGLGKTIMMASLIHSEAPDAEALTAKLKADTELARSKSTSRREERDTALKSKLEELRNADLVRRCTLVIAPMSLVGQWIDELNRASKPNTLGVVQHYGNVETRKELFKRMRVEEADVVVTSYGMLTSEHKSHGRSSDLFRYKWHRVILDEAHTIRNRSTVGARACFDLEAERRFVLTGSPIINKLTDLFSLLCFLRVRPWGTFDVFNAFIGKPFEQKSPHALEVVKVVLDSVLLRREKSMTDEDGKPIVDIPPKNLVIKHLTFSDTERAIYDKIFAQAQSQYQQMQGSARSIGGYARIFAVLMRLRQAVCHPLLLVKNRLEENEVDDKGEGSVRIDAATRKLIDTFHAGDGAEPDVEGAASAVNELMETLQKTQSSKIGKGMTSTMSGDSQDEDDDTCPLCFEDTKAVLVYLPCSHRFCKECILEHFEKCDERDEKGHCPTCRTGPVDEADLIEMVRKRKRANPISEIVEASSRPKRSARQRGSESADEWQEDENPKEESDETDEEHPPLSQGSVFFQRNSFRSSTKLEALVKDLNQLRLDEPEAKAVVFSQFTSFLDIVEIVLKRNRHSFVRLDGKMSQAQRVKVIKRFTDSPGPLIMLISLKAGGVGLNLTAAHHVWLLDCWWAAAIEAQAIDRVHRLGATKDVTVHRYLISDSIEDRIMQIQRRKTALTKGALLASAEQRDDNETEENLRLMFDD